MMNYILDAWPVIAWLEKQKGHLRVDDLIRDAIGKEVNLSIGIINFGEVFYQSVKRHGMPAARGAEQTLRMLPIEIVAPADEELVMRAAYLKAQFPISYADAFAAALAEQKKATLVTGDPDFLRLEKLISIEWL